MPHINKTEAAMSVDEPMIEGRYAELGDYTVGFETHKLDFDPGPLFAGLPGNRCQCPHWGVVLAGRVVFRYADHDEEYTAGDAYYGAPGHLPLLFAGTEVVEFSPSDGLAATMAVVTRNAGLLNSEV
ncbi:cupin domain-containing protein [Amycolatopsis pithecellobii]|uniref:Cupin domain-containing protein n=1 Tax=Amycolatopsis pithecellobii TaxID=664692 RepID=A0A6N7YHT4_9PSEU|nr:cupin domain-containing protein [Amycolatopsis pithecellobii]MTD52457.1 cupin domain-containing protein [Amycolatopsis pithecellobii]